MSFDELLLSVSGCAHFIQFVQLRATYRFVALLGIYLTPDQACEKLGCACGCIDPEYLATISSRRGHAALLTMNPSLLRPSGLVCRACRARQRAAFRLVPSVSRTSLLRERRLLSSRSISLRGGGRSERLRQYVTQSIASDLRISPTPTDKKAKIVTETDLSDPESALNRLIAGLKRICSSPTLPDELVVLELLGSSRQLSEMLIYGETDKSLLGAEGARSDTPTSSILGLEESAREGAKAPIQMSVSFRQRASAALAKNLHELLCDPKIYISPPMLQVYVRIQVLLGKPEYLPEVFHLYAHKPMPRPSKPSKSVSSTTSAQKITYTPSSPRNPKNSIPIHLASSALSSSIALKSLPLSLSIIETTIATPAFRLHKLLRRATLPLAFLALTPFCAYTISTYIGHHWQNTYDPTLATWLIAAGIMTYVGTTATMGFVALTTSNDQMVRVVWRPGLRLRDRWLREEERAAFDRLALAWGFREKWRWGEERGTEWEALREFCARRGMVLDKTELMDGME